MVTLLSPSTGGEKSGSMDGRGNGGFFLRDGEGGEWSRYGQNDLGEHASVKSEDKEHEIEEFPDGASLSRWVVLGVESPESLAAAPDSGVEKLYVDQASYQPYEVMPRKVTGCGGSGMEPREMSKPSRRAEPEFAHRDILMLLHAPPADPVSRDRSHLMGEKGGNLSFADPTHGLRGQVFMGAPGSIDGDLCAIKVNNMAPIQTWGSLVQKHTPSRSIPP